MINKDSPNKFNEAMTKAINGQSIRRGQLSNIDPGSDTHSKRPTHYVTDNWELCCCSDEKEEKKN